MKSLYRKGKNYTMPSYLPNEEERKWYRFCVINNIRISPWGIQNDAEHWHIRVNLGPYKKGEKPNISPYKYDRKQIWPEYYKMCKYYYDKYKK
jgi:hypothetical protein